MGVIDLNPPVQNNEGGEDKRKSYMGSTSMAMKEKAKNNNMGGTYIFKKLTK